MRNRIAALIIDPDKKEHDYDKVTVENSAMFYRSYGELGFDLQLITSTDNILSELNKFKGFDCIITINESNNINYEPLNRLSFEFRKKWINFDKFDPDAIAESIICVFLNNINRKRDDNVKLFSIFTCTYKTSNAQLYRLYDSLKAQTYVNWNWYILDDSPYSDVIEKLEKLHDPRIVVFRNITNHGVIGFNKHMIAMACDGDYLVEVDHDDELTPDCLELLAKAFKTYPDTDFVYSHAMELVDGREIYYGNHFAYGLGEYRMMDVKGVQRNIALTANINAVSVRGIHALPNHVRCWKSDFYRKIGGHNTELSILDDMDILIRTFLNGKMTLVDKVLYIQDEGTSSENRRGTSTQSFRFKEIQRTNDYLRCKYDDLIHKRIIELGAEDPCWVNDTRKSSMNNYDKSKLVNFNYILKC